MKYRQAMDNTLDVLTFLAYAATLGLFIGALLGGLALLLATPAHAAGEPAGTLLLRAAADASATPARLLSSETTLHADGPIQRVRIVQAFRNPLGETREGLYTFRLPDNATLERLAVRIGAAADDEDDEPAAAPSLALLAGEESGSVARSIAGIEPGDTVVVELEYLLVGRYDRSRGALRLLTRLPAAAGRRRYGAASPDAVPLGVESAWVDRPSSQGAPWLWLLPVVALYVLVAFFS
jgi:hypothetical protein